MRFENSPEYEAEMTARLEETKERKQKASRAVGEMREHWRKSGQKWMPMRKCPMMELEQLYGLESVIMVADEKNAAIVRIEKRFGRPIFWKKEPETILRDGMICIEGGEEDPRDDLPEWWWKYELMDQLETRFSYGETYHGAEIGFVPTKWTFLPNAADSTNARS